MQHRYRPHKRKVILTTTDSGLERVFVSVHAASRFLHRSITTIYRYWYNKKPITSNISGEEYTIELELRDGESAETIIPATISYTYI